MKRTGTATSKSSVGEIKLTSVKYVSSFKKNLISVGIGVDIQNIVVFSNSYCWILDSKDQKCVVAMDHKGRLNGLYRFISKLEAKITFVENKQMLWHCRYGHLSFYRLGHLCRHHTVLG